MLVNNSKNCKDGFFTIARIHRDDLTCVGIPQEVADNLTDEQMCEIATRLDEDYVSNYMWDSLSNILEIMGIKE